MRIGGLAALGGFDDTETFCCRLRHGGCGADRPSGKRAAGRAAAGGPGPAGRAAVDDQTGRVCRTRGGVRKSRSEGAGAGVSRPAPVQGRRRGQRGPSGLYDREGAVRGRSRPAQGPARLSAGDARQCRPAIGAHRRADPQGQRPGRSARPAHGRAGSGEGRGHGSRGEPPRRPDPAFLYRHQIADRRADWAAGGVARQSGRAGFRRARNCRQRRPDAGALLGNAARDARGPRHRRDGEGAGPRQTGQRLALQREGACRFSRCPGQSTNRRTDGPRDVPQSRRYSHQRPDGSRHHRREGRRPGLGDPGIRDRDRSDRALRLCGWPG